MAQPPADTKPQPPFIGQIYQQINDLFGRSTNALFQIEVSTTYSDIIGLLIPSSGDNDVLSNKLLPDQDAVCSWLLAEVDNWDPPVDLLADLPIDFGGSGEVKKEIMPPKRDIPNNEAGRPKKLPRVDLYQKLLDAYEAERFHWAAFQRNAPPGFSDPEKIDEYNSEHCLDSFKRLVVNERVEMLAFYAPVNKKLEAMFTVLLVRGQYHHVRRYVGFVDIESASEILLSAKENLRSSPVYFTTANWAKYLSTDFQPQDLLSSEEAVPVEIFEREKERALLLSRRNSIKAPEQDIPAFEAAEEGKIYAQWVESTVQVVKLYVKAKGNDSTSKDSKKGGLGSAEELSSALTKNRQSPISDPDCEELKENFKNGAEAESQLQLASESLSRVRLAAGARGKDKALVLDPLDEQIRPLSLDIEYPRQALDTSANATGVVIKSTEEEESITLPSQEQGAFLWGGVVIKLKSTSTFDSSFGSSSVSHMDCGPEANHTAMNTSIDIGFRAMKVEIGRPWFDPIIFQRSSEYYHLVDSKTKIAPAPSPLRKALDNINGDCNNTSPSPQSIPHHLLLTSPQA
ncbi:hypothetical protein HOY80DRAFT_1105057 [Tuber brumale]|nr:hypothetical protein HOY80DRAFT_1105057 [Tuber brumale]